MGIYHFITSNLQNQIPASPQWLHPTKMERIYIPQLLDQRWNKKGFRAPAIPCQAKLFRFAAVQLPRFEVDLLVSVSLVLQMPLTSVCWLGPVYVIPIQSGLPL